jgi:transcriptional regulator with GAF, ATPase, and Fis domain
MTTDPSRQKSAKTTHEAAPPSSFRLGDRDVVSLMVVHSPDPRAVGLAIRLDDGPVVVGRDVQGAGVCIADDRLSRVHFRVGFDGRASHHRITDAESRNGTFVSGARVDSALMRAGDVVRAGDTVFSYGDPSPLAHLHDRLAHFARSHLSVLILGETGTGKERLARAVHELGNREGPFVAVNCAALPRDLVGAELFGHTRGAFSGATQARQGLFQAAQGGTLFLDEIGDLPLSVQPILLRALQEGVVRPVGSDEEITVDVRVVAATHSRLEDAVKLEQFRADLFARLAQAVVRVPPLRERRSEVLALVRTIGKTAGMTEVGMTADAAEVLVRHSWPFNVREIESVVLGFAATEGDAVLGLGYLKRYHSGLVLGFRDGEPSSGTASSGGEPSDEAVSARDRAKLEMLLIRHLGNVSAVAKDLGKQRAQVYRWLKAEGLDPERFRAGP